jgi:hypothetical protein
LRGRASYTLPNPDRKFTPPELLEGDSITTVSKEFWDAWVIWADGAKYQPYKSGAIYARSNRNDVASIAKETAHVKTGLEPFVPKKEGNPLGYKE